MIKYIKGDLTDAEEQVIMHGVNCQGRFGSGVAGAIAKKHPYIRDQYMSHDNRVLGECQFVEYNNQIWVNAYTQDRYGYDGRQYANLKAIAYCLIGVNEYMHNHKLMTIAMPKIGCGLGGLEWDEVRQLVDELLVGIDVHVYELE